jgi:hypothetical protein
MQTRSSPSRVTLDRLAGMAGIDHKHHSKPALFDQLRARRGSYHRMQRLLLRRINNGKARRRQSASSGETAVRCGGRKKARKELCVDDVASSSGLVHIDPITRCEIRGKPVRCREGIGYCATIRSLPIGDERMR